MTGRAAEERLAHDSTSELWGEHRARYVFATSHISAGEEVVDVACGSGFGLDILTAAGARVSGYDLSLPALREARQHSPNAPVVVSDATRLPLRSRSTPAIVSFETIEHVPDALALVQEFRRVLAPHGTLVLSTPNRSFGPPELHQNNEFHIREFTAEELKDVLDTAFERVTLYGQWADPHYKYVPFLLVDSRSDPTSLPWKLLNRLPYRAKDSFSRLLSGRSFYPGEHDYSFVESRCEGTHALIAVAQGPRA